MKSIREIETLTLSQFINVLREFFLKNGFFEHTLYSTNNYEITNTDSFKLNKNLFLRYGTEPAIWQIGNKIDNFFWIGSLFRFEPRLSKVHNYEFKLLDFYIKNGSTKKLLDIFMISLNNCRQLVRQFSLLQELICFLVCPLCFDCKFK